MKKMMRKGLAILSMLCMVIALNQSSMTVFATEVSDGSGTDAEGFTVDNTGALVSYSGPGGDITLPTTATSVASSVFSGNSSITSVTIPANIALLGSGVFASCTGLTSVTIQGNISSIPAQTFANCQNLQSVYVPASVTAIGASAFEECVSLSGITIPAAVATIGDKAFYDCTSLAGVSIPSTVSSIGSNAFTGCSNLTSYSVESGNSYYASSNGMLYNKSLTKLISCPQGKSSATLADSTKIIGGYAFFNCVAINSLKLPANVTTIEANAFAGSGIRDITILPGVTSIGNQSDWSADVIYGETNSTAESYAQSNDIVFQSIGGSPTPDPDPGKNPSQNGNNNNHQSGTNNSGQTDSGNTDSGNTGSGSSGSTSGAGGLGSATASGTAGGGTSSGSGQVASTGSNTSGATTVSAHAKDATPKTGDGVNPIFFFCIAALLIGIYFVVSGKKKALE